MRRCDVDSCGHKSFARNKCEKHYRAEYRKAGKLSTPPLKRWTEPVTETVHTKEYMIYLYGEFADDFK